MDLSRLAILPRLTKIYTLSQLKHPQIVPNTTIFNTTSHEPSFDNIRNEKVRRDILKLVYPPHLDGLNLEEQLNLMASGKIWSDFAEIRDRPNTQHYDKTKLLELSSTLTNIYTHKRKIDNIERMNRYKLKKGNLKKSRKALNKRFLF